MIVSAPRVIGTTTVARIFGVERHAVTAALRNGVEVYRTGYLGQIGRRHVWNAHQLIASLFPSEADLEAVVDAVTRPLPHDPTDRVLCAVADCDDLEEVVGLCRVHLRRLTVAWHNAPRSRLYTAQLVAMCQWVVERNAYLVLPADFDPWAEVCMTPGCDESTNVTGWHGPLCRGCSARFWGNAPRRPHPSHWKRSGGDATVAVDAVAPDTASRLAFPSQPLPPRAHPPPPHPAPTSQASPTHPIPTPRSA